MNGLVGALITDRRYRTPVVGSRAIHGDDRLSHRHTGLALRALGQRNPDECRQHHDEPQKNGSS